MPNAPYSNRCSQFEKTMRINLTIIFLFILQSISSQEKDIFQVEINQKEKSEFMTDYSSFKHKFEYLYEDTSIR